MNDDPQLVAAWRAGDASAGEKLFDRYFKPVTRFFLNKVGEEASDLVQRTFLGCVEALPRYRGGGTFRSFLFAIAYRQLCSHYTAQRVQRGRLDFRSVTARDLSPSPSQLLAKCDEERLLLLGLRSLSVESQMILELFYWERATAAEIAVVLDVPLGTAKSRLRRARKVLKEKIEELAETPRVLTSTVSNLDRWAENLRLSG